MFVYSTTVRMHHTDAAGILFFANLFTLAHDCYEEFLGDLSIAEILQNQSFIIPIVHAEADYKIPIGVSEKIEITVSCEQVGKSSFTLSYEFINDDKELAATVKTVHTVVSKESCKPVEIPAVLKPKFLSSSC